MGTVLKGTDTVQDMLVKLSDGNPGGCNVLLAILKHGAEIDPQIMMGPVGTILLLDTFGIRGSKIWVLFKDICGQHLGRTIGVIRATQLGILSQDQLTKAVETYRADFDVEDVVAQVKERLPDFNEGAV